MKVQLKNITTEVPDSAVRITELSQISVGDWILQVWDNSKFPGGVEQNTRLFGQVKLIEEGNVIFGGHYTGEATFLNATTCTFASCYPELTKDCPFPHAYFLIRTGKIENREYRNGWMKNHPSYDLMM